VAAMAVVVVYLSEAYSQLKTCYSFLFCLVTSVKKNTDFPAEAQKKKKRKANFHADSLMFLAISFIVLYSEHTVSTGQYLGYE
jgi:cation transport ATPase